MNEAQERERGKVSVRFQKRLGSFLKVNGYTNKGFADIVGLNKDVISRATVYGIIPSTRSLMKIADHYGWSMAYLLGETDENAFTPSAKPSTFHKRVETLRAEKKTRYATIVRTMTCTSNSFSQWKKTNSLPGLEFLEQIAAYFNVSLDYLLGRTDRKK